MEASIQFIIESPQYTPNTSKRTRLVTSCDSWSVSLPLVFRSCSLQTVVSKKSSVPSPQTTGASSPPRTQSAKHARLPRSPVVSTTGKDTLLSAVARLRDAPASTGGKCRAAAPLIWLIILDLVPVVPSMCSLPPALRVLLQFHIVTHQRNLLSLCLQALILVAMLHTL